MPVTTATAPINCCNDADPGDLAAPFPPEIVDEVDGGILERVRAAREFIGRVARS